MKKIAILMAFFVFAGFQLLQAQTVQISGTVTSSEDGLSVPGVSVIVKGTTIGTVTDFDGNYTISAPANAVTLVYSFVGFRTMEVAIAGQTTINVLLEPDYLALEELVVIAYGTATRQSFTGSAAVVSGAKLEKIQAASVTKALEGLAPGIQVSGGSGQPGSGAAIRIRGIGSVNASNAPLYVVDGVPYDGFINAINSDDIESISILKDAASAALFGARGANGVIMITTKKGSGKGQINFKASRGFVDRAFPEYERVTTEQWYELQAEGIVNSRHYAGGIPLATAWANVAGAGTGGEAANNVWNRNGRYNPWNVAPNLVLDPVTGKLNSGVELMYQDDWQEELFQIAPRNEYILSASKATDNMDYYISAGYLNEEGLAKGSNFERFNARINANSQLNSWLKMGMNVAATAQETQRFLAEGTFTTNPFFYSRVMGPIYPIWKRELDGSFRIDPATGGRIFDLGSGTDPVTGSTNRAYAPNSNLVLTLPLDDRSFKNDNLTARTYAEVAFLRDFTFRTSVNADIVNSYYTTYQNHLYADAANVKGRSTKNFIRGFSYTLNQVLNYNKSFGDHKVDAMIGHENYSWLGHDMFATRTGFGFPTTELVAGAVAEGSSSQTDEYKLEGYFTRVGYSFSNKYFASASFRRDGSSRFSTDARWGNFWSFGSAWVISNEDFMATTRGFLSNLKLKASYGEQGNDAIGTYYGYQNLYTINDYNNANLNGAYTSQLPNEELQWEVNKNTNISVEFGLFHRITGELTYFRRESENLLFDVPLPQSTGIGSIMQNVGTMQNNGIEIAIGATIIRTPDLTWTMDFNLTHYKNEITKLPQKEIISGTKKLMVGRSIYDFWLRDYAGVDPANGAPLFYYDELDGDGEKTGNRLTTTNMNAASFYYVGTAIPDFYGGVSTGLNYKGIDLSVLVTYSQGGQMYDGTYQWLMHGGTYGTHMHRDILNRWTPENTDTDVPRLQNANTAINVASSRWLTDASFINVKNVTLGYTFPASLSTRAGIASARLYVAADNLFMTSARTGMDPQQAFTGVSDYTYIPNKTFTIGVNLQF